MAGSGVAIRTVGVPKEIKTAEHRVAMTPDGVRELERSGIDVCVETGAGAGASISDDDYIAAGASIVATAADAWAQQMVVKVKEPMAEEFAFLRDDLTLFTYLHLAAYPDVATALLAAKTTSLAYETVQLASGALPLLAPMSEVAGRLAPQMGAHFLERHNGGRGVLMGGAPGVRPARVVVLGAGNVGWNAAWIAAGMEAEVVLIDKNLDRLRWVDQIHRGRIMTLASNRGAIERSVADADLLIGAVLVAGGRAPVVVDEAMVRAMKPEAVIVDVAVDQGGCIETIRETTHDDPVYELHGVIHYAVGNMPGAVPHTSTYALTNATLPYLHEVAVHGAAEASPTRPGDGPRRQHGVAARSPTSPSPSSSTSTTSTRSPPSPPADPHRTHPSVSGHRSVSGHPSCQETLRWRSNRSRRCRYSAAELVGDGVDVGHVVLTHRLDLPADRVKLACAPCVTGMALEAAMLRMDVELDPPPDLRHGEIDMHKRTVWYRLEPRPAVVQAPNEPAALRPTRPRDVTATALPSRGVRATPGIEHCRHELGDTVACRSPGDRRPSRGADRVAGGGPTHDRAGRGRRRDRKPSEPESPCGSRLRVSCGEQLRSAVVCRQPTPRSREMYAVADREVQRQRARHAS